MKKLLCAVAASVACVTAGAQTSNFAGFSGAVSINNVSSNTRLEATSGTVVDGIGQQSWNGGIQAAYGFVTSPDWIFSVGGTYAIDKNKAGQLVSGGTSIDFSLKDSYSLYVEPGFLVNEKTLAYGKLSYEHAKGVMAVTGAADSSESLKGSSFGLGGRTMVDKKSFIQVEFKQVSYDSVNIGTAGSFKPKASVGSIGFGLKF